MRPLIFSVIIPSLFIITGIIIVLTYSNYGVLISAVGAIWLLLSFFIGYKEDEEQPMGIGRGRKR